MNRAHRRALVAAIGLLVGCRARPPSIAPLAVPAVLEAPRIVHEPLEARPLLGNIPARAMNAGAGPVAIAHSGTVIEGERVGAFVEVPAEACLLAYARASASLEDIDLAIFTDEGTPIALDESPDPTPTLLVCPPHPDRLYVALHASAGEGLSVIAAQLVPKGAADAVTRAVGARGTVTKAPEVWPGLDAQVRAHRTQLGGSWHELRRLAVAVDPRMPSSIALPIGEAECVDALIVPDDDVSAVEAELVDESGRVLARAKDPAMVRSLTVCAKAAVSGSLQIRPHAGRGPVAIVVARASQAEARALSARPEIVWLSPRGPLESLQGARNDVLKARGYPASTQERDGVLVQGRRSTLELPRTGPQACTRIDVLAGEPLTMVDAKLWDLAGELRASNDDVDGAILFGCGGGPMRLDLGTRGRPGPYRVLVRPEPWTDPVFSKVPLAASRMLERLAVGPARMFEGEATRVRYARLVADRRDVFEIAIAPGDCLALGLGAQGQGTGLELRAFDAATDDELDRAHGHRAAAIRVCAGTARRDVRIEARATAGTLDVVFGERLSKPSAAVLP